MYAVFLINFGKRYTRSVLKSITWYNIALSGEHFQVINLWYSIYKHMHGNIIKTVHHRFSISMGLKPIEVSALDVATI